MVLICLFGPALTARWMIGRHIASHHQCQGSVPPDLSLRNSARDLSTSASESRQKKDTYHHSNAMQIGLSPERRFDQALTPVTDIHFPPILWTRTQSPLRSVRTLCRGRHSGEIHQHISPHDFTSCVSDAACANCDQFQSVGLETVRSRSFAEPDVVGPPFPEVSPHSRTSGNVKHFVTLEISNRLQNDLFFPSAKEAIRPPSAAFISFI
jgi:hypothetical protein